MTTTTFTPGTRVAVRESHLDTAGDAAVVLTGTVIPSPLPDRPHVWVQLDEGCFDPADDGECPCRESELRVLPETGRPPTRRTDEPRT